MAQASHGQAATSIDGVGSPEAPPAVGPLAGGVGTVLVAAPAAAGSAADTATAVTTATTSGARRRQGARASRSGVRITT